MILRILIGIAMIVGGFFISMYSRKVALTMGPIPWVEKYLGQGQTGFFYQMFGFGLAILGIIVMFNMHTKFLVTFLGPLFNFK